MNRPVQTEFNYKVGGSLGFSHPTYVTRQADTDLLTALKAGQFCYVFNCRQMGKSSLRVRTMHQLRSEGMSCASIDMTVPGSNVSPDQWYSGVITQLFQGFNLVGTVDLKAWLEEREYLSAAQRLYQFIEEVLLNHVPEEKICILIDEIDKVLSLNFSVDHFFSLIRYCYNQRAEEPKYERLIFALFGVATPSDLIGDKTQTSFNIGQAIELSGFRPEEVQPLELGLQAKVENPQAVLGEILAWTGGQPFLSQKLCRLIATSDTLIPSGQEAAVVGNLIQTQVLLNWESQDEPVHLKTIRNRLFSKPQRTGQLLGLYRQILQQGEIAADNSSAQRELQLSGLVVKQQGMLRVSNRIYEEIFDQDWIEQELKLLRPYAEAIAAWEGSNRHDESRLLRGQALRDALEWAERSRLSSQDYQFLAASQAFDKQRVLEAVERARKVEMLETQLQSARRAKEAERKAKQELATAYGDAQRKIRIGTAVLALSLIGSAIAAGWVGYAWDKQQEAQEITRLEWAGKSALEQFEFRQIEALLTAMEAGQALRTLVKDNRPLRNYPTTTPLMVLQEILDNIWERNRLEGHEAIINSIHFSPDGKRLATASRDGTVKLWNLNGKELITLAGHQGDVFSVSFSPNGKLLATAAGDGTVKLWDLQGNLKQTLWGHQKAAYNAVFSPDGKIIVTVASNGVVKIWDLEGKLKQTFKGHQGSVYSASFSPDGQQFATASSDGTVKLWDGQGNLKQTLKGHQEAVYSVNFSLNGKLLATASRDGTAKVWSIKGKQLTTLEGHQGAVNDVSFSPDGQLLATASRDSTARIWNLEGQELTALAGHQGAVYDVSFSPNGRLLATASRETFARLWDFQKNPLEKLATSPNEIKALEASPDGQLLAIALRDGTVRLKQVRGEQLIALNHRDIVYGVSFSPDGKLLATGSKAGNVRVWDLKGEQLINFKAHQETIYGISFSPDQKLLATASGDQTIRLWDLQGKLLVELKGHQNPVYRVAFSPNDKILATASSDKTVRLWDFQGNLLQTLKGHQGAVHDVKFNHDGQLLATASGDATARSWDLQRKTWRMFKHASSLVYRVGFSADGQMLATGSEDGIVSIWDLQGDLQVEYQGEQALVNHVSFRPDGQLLTTTENLSTARIRAVETSTLKRLEQLLEQGCDWIQDYLVNHPDAALDVCQNRSSYYK